MPHPLSVEAYSDKARFYAAHPELVAGWPWQEYPDTPPLGIDIWRGKDYLYVLCPHQRSLRGDTVGTLVAFDHEASDVSVLATELDVSAATTWVHQRALM